VVGQAAAGAGEVRVEGGRVLVDLMRVAAGGVRLPDLDERAPDRVAAVVHDAAGDDDALAQGLARVPAREVGIELLDRAFAEGRTGRLRERVREDQQRLLRAAQDGRAVVREDIGRV